MGALLATKHQRVMGGFSARMVCFLCISCFCLGVLLVNRGFLALLLSLAVVGRAGLLLFWLYRHCKEHESLDQNRYGAFLSSLEETRHRQREFIKGDIWKDLYVVKERQDPCEALNQLRAFLLATFNSFLILNRLLGFQETSIPGDILGQVSHTHDIIMTLDKTISDLEMQLAAARAAQTFEKTMGSQTESLIRRRKVFFVMGIMTAFSSRKRRDSIRNTWMPQVQNLRRMEQEKGIVIRFVIGRSSTPVGVLERAIEAEEVQHQDFLRLNHVEGYHELSSKTQIYFSMAVTLWDADFYIKVDDDVHVNLGVLASNLAHHRSKPRAYIGCMKSGPVLAKQGVKYHEPEYWKFGEDGNKYFRHATGQLYAISKDLATYISANRHILHRYANEDVSLGSWFIGLDVEHIDERSMCCGTPPDCEWKAQAGNACAASFDWSCSGICKSVERMEEVHQLCGEDQGTIWHFSI